MEAGDELKLLRFFEPGETPGSVLVIESIQYLPSLRSRFPGAALFAVVSDRDMTRTPEMAGLGIKWTVLDYREEVLPFPRHTFDVVLSERMLENVANPQDIASGIGTFIKDTGYLLTSFENIRYWRVLRELMDGHYYAIVRRRYAKPEFERLLYASFYKDIFFAPVRGGGTGDEIDPFVAAGFENRLNDLDTEVWLAKALRSSSDVALLKAAYAPGARKRLAILLRRIEYEIDLPENVGALWELIDKDGFLADYIGRFAASVVVHQDAFRMALSEHSPKERQAFLDVVWERLQRISAE